MAIFFLAVYLILIFLSDDTRHLKINIKNLIATKSIDGVLYFIFGRWLLATFQNTKYIRRILM